MAAFLPDPDQMDAEFSIRHMMATRACRRNRLNKTSLARARHGEEAMLRAIGAKKGGVR
ncbi:MAG: hypothetical protein ABSC19_02535 [Syntrophorhabdales bacterium]|jgi:hypothetical protein